MGPNRERRTVASITQRENGRWRARIRRQGGRPVSETFRTKAQAEAWAASEESDIHRRVQRDYRVADKTFVRDLLSRYEGEVASRLKSAGVLHYHLARFIEGLGHLRLSALTAAELTRWRDDRLLEVKPATVRRELQTLGSVMTWARKDLLIPMPENPVSAIRLPPAGKSRDRRLEAGEETRMIKALTDRAAPVEGANRTGNYRVGTRNIWIKPIVQLAIETAMRLSELCSLRWENIDMRACTAYLDETKNGESRTVPLSSRAIALLEALPSKADEGSVFPVTASAVKQAWRRAIKRAGIKDLRLHDQRHEATSRLAEKLPNLIELAAVTGHKDLRMLKRYYHPRAEDLAKKLG